MISIVFPHHNVSENTKVLELKLKMLEENATYPYEVLYLINKGNKEIVYPFWDFAMRNAKYDLLLWDNSDIVYSKGFMDNIIKHKDDGDWIGLELVECGAIGVHPNNIRRDFGRTADDFRREEFEEWVKEYSKDRPSMRESFCWYSPSVWRKDWYIKTGGFDLTKPFPHPVDSEFREKCEKMGTKFIVVNSFAYHFQRAGENQGTKPERVSLWK